MPALPPSRRRPAVALLALGLALGPGAALAGCDRGSVPPASSSAGSGAASPAGTPSGPGCPIGRWAVPATEEFAQLGLGALTQDSVRATSGMIRVTFAADHSYVFSYDRVELSIGGSSGRASVNGPVHGTWKVAADRLTTRVSTSRITVRVYVAGVTVPPSGGLNRALSSGLPTTVRVRCGNGRLTATVASGAAAGREITFASG